MIVKVQLPPKGEVGAVLYSEDRGVVDHVPSSLVARRFARGERAAYFQATLEHGILELGDRVPAPVPAW
jgi:hypothetical protein